MNTRTLFNIILKVFGLIILIDAIGQVSYALQIMVMSLSGDEYGLMIFSPVFALLFYCIMIYYLIFRTNYVIDKLKLTSGIDDEIPLNIHHSIILDISIIVLTGVFLINEIPKLILLGFKIFQEKVELNGLVESPTTPLIVSFFKVIVALLLLSNRHYIIKYIELKRKKSR